MTHELKCLPENWPYYKTGVKNNSLRKNDRHFSVGDIVILKLWQDDRFILGEVVVRKVTHVLHDFDFTPMPKGYCLLSLKEV